MPGRIATIAKQLGRLAKNKKKVREGYSIIVSIETVMTRAEQ